MSCCPTSSCDDGNGRLSIVLNILDVVGNFAGVAVAITFGMLQLHYWRRRHGPTNQPDATDIPLELRAPRPQLATTVRDVNAPESTDRLPAVNLDGGKSSKLSQPLKEPAPQTHDTTQ